MGGRHWNAEGAEQAQWGGVVVVSVIYVDVAKAAIEAWRRGVVVEESAVDKNADWGNGRVRVHTSVKVVYIVRWGCAGEGEGGGGGEREE